MLRQVFHSAARLAASQSRGLSRGMPRQMQATFARGMAVQVMEDEDQLRDTLENAPDGKLVIIDWMASWCGPCKKIAPAYTQLSEKYTDVIFLKADVDELNEAAYEADVKSMPTFQFIKDGELVAQFEGANAEKVEALIVEHK